MIDVRARISRLLTIHFLLFLLLFARRPEVLTKAQFWAEDGAVFFAGQLQYGFFHQLSATYAGYYPVVPHLIAGVADIFPVRYVPFSYNFIALVLASLCSGLFAWPICRHLIPSDILRTITCFVAVTAVYAGNEVVGSIANLQWFLLVAALILVSYQETLEAKPAWLYILLAAADLLISLSAPLVLVLIPWLLWQALRKKGLGRFPALSTLAGTLLEIATFLRSSEVHGTAHGLRLSSIFVAVIGTEISRPVLGTVLGHQYLTTGSLVGLASKFMAALIFLTAGLAWLYSSLSSYGRRIIAITLYLSISLIAVAMLGRNLADAFLNLEGFRFLQGERYFFAPGFLFVFLIAFWIDHLLRTYNGKVKAAALLLLFSYGTVRNFRLPPLADLSWSHYASAIDDWAAKRDRGEHPPPITVPINPVPFSLTLQ